MPDDRDPDLSTLAEDMYAGLRSLTPKESAERSARRRERRRRAAPAYRTAQAAGQGADEAAAAARTAAARACAAYPVALDASPIFAGGEPMETWAAVDGYVCGCRLRRVFRSEDSGGALAAARRFVAEAIRAEQAAGAARIAALAEGASAEEARLRGARALVDGLVEAARLGRPFRALPLDLASAVLAWTPA